MHLRPIQLLKTHDKGRRGMSGELVRRKNKKKCSLAIHRQGDSVELDNMQHWQERGKELMSTWRRNWISTGTLPPLELNFSRNQACALNIQRSIKFGLKLEINSMIQLREGVAVCVWRESSTNSMLNNNKKSHPLNFKTEGGKLLATTGYSSLPASQNILSCCKYSKKSLCA